MFELTQGHYYNIVKSDPANQIHTGEDRYLYPCKIGYDTMRGGNGWPESGHADITSDSVCGKLFTLSGMVFDLPTSAQWEYACRAGAGTLYYYGSDASILGDYAWYVDNSDGHAHQVGLKLPNAWGLYDMMGNQHEMVLDFRCNRPDLLGQSLDPVGPATGSDEAATRNNTRLLRGGAYNVAADSATCAGGKGQTVLGYPANTCGGRVCAPAIAVQ